MEKEIDIKSYSQEEVLNLGTLDAILTLQDSIHEMEEEMEEGQIIELTNSEDDKIIVDSTILAIWSGVVLGIERQSFDEGYGEAAMQVLKCKVEVDDPTNDDWIFREDIWNNSED